jgi:hypothetical protein
MVINNSRKTNLAVALLALIAIAAMAVSAWFALSHSSARSTPVIQILPFLFIGLTTCIFQAGRSIILAIGGGVLLRIDDTGIEDNRDPFGPGLIPWSEIASVELRDSEGHECLGFSLKDISSIQRRLGRIRTRQLLRNLRKSGLPLRFKQIDLNVPEEELARNVSHRFGIPLSVCNFENGVMKNGATDGD